MQLVAATCTLGQLIWSTGSNTISEGKEDQLTPNYPDEQPSQN
jgi:hypothetical protein